MKETGSVKAWKDEQGYGFIRPDCGDGDLFIHRRELPDGETITVGMRLSFTCEKGSRGLYATDAQLAR